MASSRGKHAGSTLMLTTVLLSAAAQAALAGTLTALTMSTLDGTHIKNLAIAACALAFATLASSMPIGLILGRSSPCPNARARNLSLIAMSFTVFLTGCILSVYTFAYTWIEVLPQTIKNQLSPAFGLTIAGFATWALSTFLQITAHLALALRKQAAPSEPTPIQEVAERQSPRIRRPMSIRLKSIGTPPFTRPSTALTSPTLTGYLDSPSSARSSLRHSLHQVIRPITSRTKLLRMQSPPPQTVQSLPAAPRRQDSSLDFGCRGDGFETWDTSAVEENFINPFSPSSVPPSPKFAHSMRKGSLPPIPGSRPVSPAKALEGPFHIPDYQQTQPQEYQAPSSSNNSSVSLPHTPTAATHDVELSPPRVFADAEAHIHPLFRSHSPTPAPNPSPGTVVQMDGAEVPRRFGSVTESTRSARSVIGSRKEGLGQVRGPSALGTHAIVSGEEAATSQAG